MLDDDILDIFREETREHLAALEQSFLSLETADNAGEKKQLIDTAFRRAHSLKGDARVVDLPDLMNAAQHLEDILDEMRSAPDSVTPELVDRGLASFDNVRAAYDAWQRPAGDAATEVLTPSEPAPSAEDIPPKVDPPPTKAPAPRKSSSPTSPAAEGDEAFTVRVPSDRLFRMLNLAGDLQISLQAGESVSERLLQLREELEALKRSAGNGAALTSGAADQLLDQVRRIETDIRNWRAREGLLVNALEADIRQARLLPLVMLTDSLRRAVRELSQSLEKPVRYEAAVGSVMLDKAVIELLKDPLQHMVRNAMDHGIESPADRAAAGKPEEALIRITAVSRGPIVKIRIADDGGGIQFDRIRKKLRDRGLRSDEEIADMSEAELAACMFEAGFSTAQAGEVSGRGVGLDVVRDAMHRLQGSVELESSSSAGAVFCITVPVTIASVRMLTAIIGGNRYGIASSSIIRTGRARQEDLRELEGRPVLMLEGEAIRWTHLADLLGREVSPRAKAESAWSYFLISDQGKRAAVVVDDFEDERQALLKPLGFPLQGLRGITGSVIQVDGSVQLVIDAAELMAGASRQVVRTTLSDRPPAGRILVADDSPTTRAVLRNVFTAAGYVVTTATDGVDALERLAVQNFDLVVSDVEMPRLTGFDLTRRVKSKYGLPVILVTGRENEEDRREGLQAGADAYVVKSTFEDQSLLEIVEQFV